MIDERPFGEHQGARASLFVLKNENGSEAHLTNYGATLVRLLVPDRHGQLGDVVLGFDTLKGYVDHHAYIGASIGRVANRIQSGQFELEQERYEVARNDPPNHLHGGVQSWDRLLWTPSVIGSGTSPALGFTLVSPNGNEGYPGQVQAEVRFELSSANQLRVEMTARTTQTTLVNMAHHSYWNLSADARRSVLGHELTLFADEYTPGTPVVPDGRLTPVAGTAFDFRVAKHVGADLGDSDGQIQGYDHNYVVRGPANQQRAVAELYDPESGRCMRLLANQPGVQLYSGNFLDGSLIGKQAIPYQRHAGLCLETQGFPNAINVPAWRDQVILHPQAEYRHVMVHAFTTR